jgi:hypothetical protein
MQSRLVPGLFVCGELLDVDGPIGGLQLPGGVRDEGRLAGLHAGGPLQAEIRTLSWPGCRAAATTRAPRPRAGSARDQELDRDLPSSSARSGGLERPAAASRRS